MFVIQQPPRLLHGEHRNAGRLGQCLQLGRGHRVAGGVAGDDYRAARAPQQRRRLLDEGRVALGPPHRAVFRRQILGQFVFADFLVLKIDGQGEMHRAGAAGGGSAEGGRHEFGDAFAVVNQPRAFGDRGGHRHLVDFLKGGHAFFGEFGAAGDEHHRGFGSVDGGQGADGVGKAGAAGEDAGRRAAGDAGVAVGHMQRGALVAGVDELDALIGGGVHQGQNSVADDGKDFLDALLLEAANEQMRPGKFRHCAS